MKLDKKVFDKQGYIHIKDIVPSKVISPTRRIAINLKRDKISELGKPREHGTGTYWRGIEMASKLEEALFFTYIHPCMQQIVPVFLNTKTIYLFNDQVVVKLPKEDYVQNDMHSQSCASTSSVTKCQCHCLPSNDEPHKK